MPKKIELIDSNSKLQKACMRIAKGHLYLDRDFASFTRDLQYGGCQSGLVGELIYYTDTLKFFKRHQVEINELLKQTLSDFGSGCPADVFGEKWDKEDPLILETTNQNLLAWFAFEETIFSIARYNDLDI